MSMKNYEGTGSTSNSWLANSQSRCYVLLWLKKSQDNTNGVYGLADFVVIQRNKTLEMWSFEHFITYFEIHDVAVGSKFPFYDHAQNIQVDQSFEHSYPINPYMHCLDFRCSSTPVVLLCAYYPSSITVDILQLLSFLATWVTSNFAHAPWQNKRPSMWWW